jgi:hypothetical protein
LCICVRTCACVHPYVYAFMRVCACMHGCFHACVFTGVCVCVCVLVCVCVCIYVYVCVSVMYFLEPSLGSSALPKNAHPLSTASLLLENEGFASPSRKSAKAPSPPFRILVKMNLSRMEGHFATENTWFLEDEFFVQIWKPVKLKLLVGQKKRARSATPQGFRQGSGPLAAAELRRDLRASPSPPTSLQREAFSWLYIAH